MPTEIEVKNIAENIAQISAYPFESGFAITLAHPIRRLLYSSTVGFATTAVKIEGVTHEFDSIRGMVEDVALFIINLKNIRFKLKNDEKKAVINYSFTGPKEIRGEDLQNDEVEVVNPDAYLATINEDAELNFSIIVEKGIGYVPSEDIRDLVDEYIAIDAFFTPVKKAVYDIQNILVEDNPNFEKIVFTVETDGQISPIDAFRNSLEAMQAQMSVFNSILDTEQSGVSESASGSIEIKKLLQPVAELNLSARSFNCLDRAEVKYIGELVLMSDTQIKSLKNLGKKSLEEIKNAMEEIGFPIGTELSEDASGILKKKIENLKSESK
jgi:DNA-directed RNA polymerase subunit alpha